MRHANLLNNAEAVLLIIDMQERFRPHVPDFKKISENICKFIQACRLLDVPILVTEQYPQGLGQTAEEIASLMAPALPFAKTAFSCCGAPAFMTALKNTGRKAVIVCGIEAHVCISQTVHELITAGYKVHIIKDAISSRFSQATEVAWEKMVLAGAVPSGVEMALMEMVADSKVPIFKKVQSFVK